MYDRLWRAAAEKGPAPVAAYWEARMRQLPGNEELVTGDEIALAARIRTISTILYRKQTSAVLFSRLFSLFAGLFSLFPGFSEFFVR